MVALEDLQVGKMVKNHHLAKSISDIAQLRFRQWLEYVGKIFGVTVIAVAPHYTFQECSCAGEILKHSRDPSFPRCLHCGYVEERDVKTNKNILRAALCQQSRVNTHPDGLLHNNVPDSSP